MNIFNDDLSTKLTAVQKWNKVDLDKHYPPNSTFGVDFKTSGQEQANIEHKNVVIFLDTQEMGIDGEHSYTGGVSQAFKTLKDDLESLGNKGYISSNIFHKDTKYPDVIAKEKAAASHFAVGSDEYNAILDGYKLTESEKRTLRTLRNVVTSPYLSSKIANLHLGQSNLGLLVRIKAYREINNFLKLNGYTLTSDMGIFDIDQIRTPYVFPEKIMAPDANSQWIFDANRPLPIYEPSPFIKTSTIIYSWLGIMGVLMGATVFIYSRRDFK